MRRSVLVVAALLLSSGLASAQPGPTFSPPGLTPPTVQLSPAPGETANRKDPSIAVLLSLGITTASYVTLFASDGNEDLALVGFIGTYIGPSTGQWYAGRFGGLGLGLRAVGFVSFVYGFSQVLASECDYEYDNCSDSDGDAGGVLMLAGAGLWVGSSIYDIVLAKRAADSWNARHNVSIAPIVTNDAAGHRNPGLAFTGRF